MVDAAGEMPGTGAVIGAPAGYPASASIRALQTAHTKRLPTLFLHYKKNGEMFNPSAVESLQSSREPRIVVRHH